MTSDRDALRSQILDKAVVHGKVVLSSGREADYYVDLRRATLKLDAHLLAYFPGDRVRPLPERWPALDRQVRTAYAQGFTSQSDLTYYINIFAWLGSSPLEQHPQIARLLSTPSAQTPSARIAAAAELASAWASAHSADKDRP